MNVSGFDPLGWEGLAFEPQVQVVYQHLNFAERLDADGTNVNLGDQDEGVFRRGERLVIRIDGFWSAKVQRSNAFVLCVVLHSFGVLRHLRAMERQPCRRSHRPMVRRRQYGVSVRANAADVVKHPPALGCLRGHSGPAAAGGTLG